MASQIPVRAAAYKSPYGPRYSLQPNLKGANFTTISRTALKAGSFSGAAVVAVLLFTSSIPIFRRDILQVGSWETSYCIKGCQANTFTQNIPLVGRYFVKQEIHPQDNDEVFHIPQAQKYCEGRFLEWDDKITTPPGLYIFSVLLQKTAKVAGNLWASDCGASTLRFTNVLGLIVLAYLALLCRHEIESRFYEARSGARLKSMSTYVIHTAVNIALFPLLFFFSGLYYTDVISTAVVLGAFLNHLKRVGRDRSSWTNDLMTLFFGVAALFMRQTNVFWIVVWMGGLEAVHAIKTLRPERVDRPFMPTLTAQLKFSYWRYSVGDVHDAPLGLAWPDDMLLTLISLGIAVLHNPVRVIRQIWPYISVLIAFVGFVAWNGGVVLGDKSNHVATIHLTQMLYIWPFFAFFSLPLLLPYAVPLFDTAIALFGGKARHNATEGSGEQSISGKGIASKGDIAPRSRLSRGDSSSAKLSPALRTTCRMLASPLPIWLLYVTTTLAASAAVVKFNTIVHPFTLADNRHYMFYIFRYTIRRGDLFRLLLIIPYTFSRWMVWGTLAGCTDWIAPTRSVLSSSARYSVFQPTANTSTASRTIAAPISGQRDGQAPELAETDPLAMSCEPCSTSTGLIFLLTTALSLVTAPLVEPRYFIIPWVTWRLLVPAWKIPDHDHYSVSRTFGGQNAQSQSSSCMARLLVVLKRYDVRLVLETIWLVAINVATGYIFLTKPYVWRDENGLVLDEGRLQRFMW
ncbi:hypothetical protein E4U60_001329 [Claviceps pazoutovae]|uniref:Dol-P-Glc:Glc(2)Man(9)GlcNAc(2)-PP-Dol alpha-1,2-glucosyltransferase n=1 Tax=Claviceps pazoutovae TaxID=1649127 RepID=A0A9P7SHJ4_9HYPO|nr:hypothetical protein E4U60_001329 [Claviceps pazoutovae]